MGILITIEDKAYDFLFSQGSISSFYIIDLIENKKLQVNMLLIFGSKKLFLSLIYFSIFNNFSLPIHSTEPGNSNLQHQNKATAFRNCLRLLINLE